MGVAIADDLINKGLDLACKEIRPSDARQAPNRFATRFAQDCVTIHKNTALFMLCDRAGIVACYEFDYIRDPKTFLTFFYRLGRMTDAQLGFDTTFRPVASADPDIASLTAFKTSIKLPHHMRY